MSQKVAVTRVRVHGRPYLGQSVNTNTGEITDEWSSSPGRVMDWLCSGFQTRFNQRRSCRSKYLYTDGQRVLSVDGKPLLTPIGHTVTDVSDAQSRMDYLYLRSLPSQVLEATNKTESTDWFAGAKRRKSHGGKMPGFRSRHKHDARFVCWFNGGKGATFVRTGRRSGVVRIGGVNTGATRESGQPARWFIAIHVRLSQEIRDYTSVRVNWTRREVVFVNEPLPVERRGSGATGYDRGVARALAGSDGSFHDAPDVSGLIATRKRHQRKMAKSKVVAAKQHRKFWESNRYQAHKAAAGKVSSRISRVMGDWRQKVSTDIARHNTLVAFEDLRLANMTRSASGKGASAKRGLNRSLLVAGLGDLAAMTKAKVERAGGTYVAVNPAYTSQRCHPCGHTARENRESQAVFLCQRCGHTDNADTNAARNILVAALQTAGTTAGTGSGRKTADALASAAPAMNRQPPTATAV